MIRCPLYSCIHRPINQRCLRQSAGIHFREFHGQKQRRKYKIQFLVKGELITAFRPAPEPQIDDKTEGTGGPQPAGALGNVQPIPATIGARATKKLGKQLKRPKQHTQPSIYEALEKLQQQQNEQRKREAERTTQDTDRRACKSDPHCRGGAENPKCSTRDQAAGTRRRRGVATDGGGGAGHLHGRSCKLRPVRSRQCAPPLCGSGLTNEILKMAEFSFAVADECDSQVCSFPTE